MLQEFTGKEYLKIDIANSFGLDKENWDTRIDWFNQNENDLFSLMKEAESPAMFFAGVNAWNQVKEGKPIGYGVSLDSCSSGLQVLSCLIGDYKSAKQCGLIDTGKREDAYTNLYKIMCTYADVGNITRDNLKRAIMTSLYSSDAVPEEVFGKHLPLFFKVMEEECPYVWQLNNFFKQGKDKNALTYEWVMPDNGNVVCKIKKEFELSFNFMGNPYKITKKFYKPNTADKSLGANITHSVDSFVVRELVGRCDFNPIEKQNCFNACMGLPITSHESEENLSMTETLWNHYKQTGYLSIRIIKYIDNFSIDLVDKDTILYLLGSMPRKPFQILTIHDSFRFIPNYGNDLRKQYNLILSQLCKSNLLTSIVSQALRKHIQFGKADTSLSKEIINANYALS